MATDVVVSIPLHHSLIDLHLTTVDCDRSAATLGTVKFEQLCQIQGGQYVSVRYQEG